MSPERGGPAADVLTALAAAWVRRDAAAAAALFEAADAIYLDASERDSWLGKEAIARELASRFDRTARVVARVGDMRSRRLGADLASVFAIVDRATADSTSAPLLGQSLRVTLVARCRDGRWAACHYAEAPIAPLLELQAFYEAIAAEGFA
jgi:uncharacterized protein (TIGR02246 family)